MKRGMLGLLSLFLINFVSAALFDGYGGFSLSNLFYDFVYSPDSAYILFFIIIFTLCLLVLSKSGVFKNFKGEPNVAAAGAISFAIAALVIYYLYRSGFSGENILSWLGFSGDAGSLIFGVIGILAAAFLIWKLKFPGFLMFSGLALVFIGLFTELIEEKAVIIVIGIILAGIGVFFRNKEPPRAA